MDLLRAAAILLVLLAHSIRSYGEPGLLAPLQLGGTGVDLFFVLSGWLLGGLLFKELSRDGHINIKRFWVRRWMRTLPAYYTVLLLQIAQRYMTKDNVEFPWQHFVFVQNYTGSLDLFFVSWSLCVEEQFYLMIAPLLAFLALFKKKMVTVVLLILLILPLVFRELELYSDIKETHVRLDCCVMGVFLAHIYHQYKAVWSWLADKAPQIAMVGLVAYLLFYVDRYLSFSGVESPDQLILAFVFGSWIILANASTSWIDKLYVPGAYYIATRSYALYLLHPDVLSLQKRYMQDTPFIFYFVVTMVGSMILAEILYRLIEKPIMDSREKFKLSASRKVAA
jgi:peptidoglycan/LPS O-acetylase OafA/YrhL